jgi:hypothetical protein
MLPPGPCTSGRAGAVPDPSPPGPSARRPGTGDDIGGEVGCRGAVSACLRGGTAILCAARMVRAGCLGRGQVLDEPSFRAGHPAADPTAQ